MEMNEETTEQIDILGVAACEFTNTEIILTRIFPEEASSSFEVLLTPTTATFMLGPIEQVFSGEIDLSSRRTSRGPGVETVHYTLSKPMKQTG